MSNSKLYNREDIVRLFEEFLDNCIKETAPEKESNMASQYRESYTIEKPDGTKETVRLYGKDKSETDAKFQAMCRSIALNNSKWNSNLSFRDFVEQEYKPNYMVKPFIAETTRGKYEYNLKRYIYPEFGDKPIAKLTVSDIQSFRKKMAEASANGYKKNLTSKSIEDMTGFLNKIFKVAAAMGVIEDNPVKRPLLKKIGESPSHHKPMDKDTLDRCKTLIPRISDEQVRIYAAILFYNGGGMRPEEILGLKWEHIDLESGYADIVQAVAYALPSRSPVVKETKTPNSVRGVILPKILVDILQKCMTKHGYVIHGRDRKKPVPYSTWQRVYKKMQDELGIRGKYCNYDLRTTYATEMIEDGHSSALTAKLMGHKDSRMVETVYAQTRRSGIEQMREAIEHKNAYGSYEVPKSSV